MKHNFKVDKEKCIKCGLCVSDCLTGAIKQNENGEIEMQKPLNCIKCQHCFAICPTGAISIQEAKSENASLIREINPDDLLNLIQSRRSIRKYKKMNVSKEIIQKLKDMLNYSPTGKNDHNLHFSFIEDIEVMDDFRNKVNQKIISTFSKKPFEFLSKKNNKFAQYKNAFLNGEDIIFRGAPHMVVACAPINSACPVEDGLIALSYFELYANSLGLGTLWCGYMQTVLKLFPELCKYQQIPEGYMPVYVILFGYKDIEYKRTIQPTPYKFTTIEKQDIEMSFVDKVKRFFWNFIR